MSFESLQDRMVTQFEIEQFYYREAELLEAGRYEDWIEASFTEDIHYWMPVRETHNDRDLAIRGLDELAIYDDDRAFLLARAERFKSALAHAELPPSRLRYFVNHVRLSKGEAGLNSVCNLLVNQTRVGSIEHQYFGERQDSFVQTEAGWRIRRRRILLDYATLPRSLTVFF